jgi:di/tricarboxylate transporter
MAPELLLIIGLAAIFIIPIATDLNVGIVAFVVAILTGTLLLGYSSREILAGFPGQMFILIVGITLLVAIAQSNGTIDWIVGKLMALAGGKLILLPPMLFLTSFVASSLGPGAAPILFVIGAGFISRFNLNPLLVAAMVIHGAQSGAYSPIAPYGVVINQLAADAAITYSPVALYLGVVGFHLALVSAVFVLLGGLKLRGQIFADGPEPHTESAESTEEHSRLLQYLTVAGFVMLLVSVVAFQVHLGFAALAISFCLLICSPKTLRSDAVDKVAWPIVLVISGVLTYVSMIQKAGAIDWMAAQVSQVGSPEVIGLFLCFLVSIVTGVASTIGTIGMLVPLSAPFIVSGDLDGTGLLTAMAISAAVSDVSPFSTWGALFLATVASVVDKEKVLRALLIYTGVIVCTLPALAWLLFVVIP